MIYGYARVSTGEQSPALQLTALKNAGCQTIFRDNGLSGKNMHRPGLKRCLKALASGDTLTVWKMDRLARSLKDLISILDDLKGRGVSFLSVTESIDTGTPAGRAMWQLIGVFAELERSMIQERTQAGLKEARRRGVKFGPKEKLNSQQILRAKSLIDKGEKVSDVAKLYNVSRATLYRVLAA